MGLEMGLGLYLGASLMVDREVPQKRCILHGFSILIMNRTSRRCVECLVIVFYGVIYSGVNGRLF